MQYPDDFVLWVGHHNWSGYMQPDGKTKFTLVTHAGYPSLTLSELYWYYLFLKTANLI